MSRQSRRLFPMTLPCAVLPDGTRLLSQGGFTTALGPVTGGWQQRQKAANEDSGDLPSFLVAKSLQPFISEDLRTLVSAPRRAGANNAGTWW